MSGLAVAAAFIAALLAAAVLAERLRDRRAERRVAAELAATQPADPLRFDPAMVAALPVAARCFFGFAIAPGTPLRTVAEITMTGRFSLGTKQKPGAMAMRARETLAAPHGFVWRMSARRGLMRLSGSDAATERTSWTRFWLMGALPVARIGGSADHRRSAFGRYVAEAVFWTPAALLPGPGVTWEGIDERTARVTLSHDGMVQPVDVTVDADGRPLRVVFQRWSDANAERTFRLQPFGGHLSAFARFDGFRLPTHVEAGNHFGTDDYFAFFIADVSDIAFPPGGGRRPEAVSGTAAR